VVSRNYAFSEGVKGATAGRGADVIYDGLGQAAAKENFAALAMRGHWVSYGHASGPLQPLSLSEKSGTFSQPVLFHFTAAHLQEMAGNVFRALRDGTIRAEVQHRYPLAAASDAHRDLEARRTSGQVVLLP
jgi:NADPH:quinone reductase-like Zn-dependent oxidoreductase